MFRTLVRVTSRGVGRQSAPAPQTERDHPRTTSHLRQLSAGILALSLVTGMLAIFGVATTAGAQTTESFTLTSASQPGQSSVTWQGPPLTGTPNVFPSTVSLSGQIDPTTGDISAATLSLPALPQGEQEGESTTFTFSEVNPGSATGTFDSSTGAVTINDSLTLTFTGTGVASIECVSTPIDVALSGTYDSTSQDVTLTASGFTIPQFPSASGQNCDLAAGNLNQSPGGVAGAVGNAFSLALNGQFAPGLATTTALTTSVPSPQLAGTSVTLTASVVDPSAQGTPTGNVTFDANGVSVGTGTLSPSGTTGTATATVTTTALPSTANELTASYGGDSNYSSSSSTPVGYTIQALPTISSTFPSQVPIGPLGTFPTSTPFTVTVTNPAGGATLSNLFLYLGIVNANNGTFYNSSAVQLSYQDAAGNWCPLTISSKPPSGSKLPSGSDGVYLGGPGAATCQFSPSFSLDPGQSQTLNLEIALMQRSTTTLNFGTFSFVSALETGICTSSSSCTPEAPLMGATAPTSIATSTAVNASAPSSVPSAISLGGVPAPDTTNTIHSGNDMEIGASVKLGVGSGYVETMAKPTGSVQFFVNGQLVTTQQLSSDGYTTDFYYNPGNLAPGTYTETADYLGDTTYAPSSTSQTFNVVAAATGSLYACVVTNPLLGTPVGTFNGYVNVNGNGVPTAAVSGTTVTLSNASVSLDLDPASQGGDNAFVNPQTSPSITFSPGQVAVDPGSTTFAASPPTNYTDLTGTWSGLSTTVVVTGNPGDQVPVAVGSISFSYSLSGSVNCTPVAQPATFGSVEIVGTTLTTSPSGAAQVGTPVTLTAAVAPMPPASTQTVPSPPGQVDFFDGTNYLGTATVASSGAAAGTASLTVNSLAVGSHDLTATWSGYSGVPPSTSNTVDYFVGNPTTTALTSSATSPSNGAQPVTFTATVTPPTGSTVMPTNTVSFTDNGNPISSCTALPLNTDSPPTATCTLNLGPGASDAIVATYSGDANYLGSTSSTLTQDTLPGVSVTASSSANPVGANDNVSLVANVVPVTPGGPTPTGTVDFQKGGKTKGACGAVPVNANGTATCAVSFADAGTSFNITAVYSGDGNYSGATSAIYHLSTLPGTTTKLSSTKNPSAVNQTVTFVAEIRPSGASGPKPQGYAGFFVNGKLDMACMLVPLGNGGRARCTLTPPVGTSKVYAVYAGDGAYSGSTSNTVAQAVNVSASRNKAGKKK